MKTFGIIPALIAASACLVHAAPAQDTNFGGLLGPISNVAAGSGVGTGVANAGQDAVAEVFKLADGVLNIPGDAIGKVMSGDPIGALTGLGSDAVKLVGGLPADLMQIPGDVVKGMTGGASSSKAPAA